MISSVEELLIREEGEVLHAYQDSLGYWTIGVGILIDQRKSGGLRKEESRFILDNRINLLRQHLSHVYSWFNGLDQVRRAVIISMVWQVGSLDGWPRFCNAMAVRDYEEAAKEMLDSKVAREQAPARWQRQAEMMRSGSWCSDY